MTPKRPWQALLAVLLTAYALGALFLNMLGRTLTVPWPLVLFLAFVSLPIALVLAAVLVFLPERLSLSPPGWRARCGCVACGLGVAWVGEDRAMWLVAMLPALVLMGRLANRRAAANFGIGVLAMTVGFAALSAWNSLLALGLSSRLVDPTLIQVDLALLRLFSAVPNYDAVFPLVDRAWAVLLFQRSYLFQFSEILLFCLVLARRREDLIRWLTTLFTGYGVALLTFVVLPAVGPPIFTPASFAPEYQHTVTFQVMQSMYREFQHLRDGGVQSGYAYFIALPSMHVAVAALAQFRAREWPWLFWTLLPINFLLISSTFVLGYHYFLDIPAGLLLAAGLVPMLRRLPTATILDGKATD